MLVKFIIFIMFICTISFYLTRHTDVKYIKSDVDNKMYLVRDLPDAQRAANMLGRIRGNVNELIKYMQQNTSDDDKKEYDPYIKQLANRFEDCIINESTSDSVYTSYSVNKGEQIVFCLRSRNQWGELHDLNLVMYVALHEIAHVACPEYGHTPLFKRIFAFFTKAAIKKGIYKRIDFPNQPVEYCGISISESII